MGLEENSSKKLIIWKSGLKQMPVLVKQAPSLPRRDWLCLCILWSTAVTRWSSIYDTFILSLSFFSSIIKETLLHPLLISSFAMGRVREQETTLQHFSHSHPLQLCNLQPQDQTQCNGCKSPCTGLAYRCTLCNYYLHRACTQIPNQIHHPSHPHPLALLPTPTYPTGFPSPATRVADRGLASHSTAKRVSSISTHLVLPFLAPSPIEPTCTLWSSPTPILTTGYPTLVTSARA